MLDPMESVGLTGLIVGLWSKLTGSEAISHEDHDKNLSDSTMAEVQANRLMQYYARNELDVKHLEQTLGIIEDLLKHTNNSTINVGFEYDVEIKNNQVKLIKLE